MNDSDRFFQASAPPRPEPSRPRAVNPVTGVEQSWQRASNYAAPLDDPHGLIRWKLRELIKGISLRPDLARMLLTGAAIEDNSKADDIIAAAHAVAGIDASANEGTAVHAALTRSFLGHEVPEEYRGHVKAFADELRRNGLTPVATEVRTLCIALGVIGHTDWIVRTADGRYLILDVKTGKLRDARKFAVQCKAYAGAEYIDDGNGNWVPIPFKIDQTEAILAHVDPETGATALYRVDLVLGFYGASLAERVRDWNKINVLGPYTPVHPAIPTAGVTHPEHSSIGARVEVVRTQLPEPSAPRPDFLCRFDGKAASAHPIQTPDFHCISPEPRPDGSEASLQQIEQRMTSPIAPELWDQAKLASPSTDPAELRTPSGWLESGTLGAIRLMADEAWATPMTWGDFLARYNPRPVSAVTGAIEVTDFPRPASVKYPADPNAPLEHPDNPETRAKATEEIQRVRDKLTFEELMRNDKPKLQAIAKNLGCTDLAHQRAWLAHWIIATQSGADANLAEKYAKSKGTIPLGPGRPSRMSVDDARSAAENPDGWDRSKDKLDTDGLPRSSTEEERQAGDLQFIFRSIEGAKSEGALLALRDNVVERRGDHAWTDEMAEAARRKVTELIAAEGNAVDPVRRMLARIEQATEPVHIAALWNEATISGSAPENWTPELKAAADEKLVHIQQAQGSPPANPYGPQA